MVVAASAVNDAGSLLNRVGRGDEGEGGDDDLVAGADVEPGERQVQRRGFGRRLRRLRRRSRGQQARGGAREKEHAESSPHGQDLVST